MNQRNRTAARDQLSETRTSLYGGGSGDTALFTRAKYRGEPARLSHTHTLLDVRIQYSTVQRDGRFSQIQHYITLKHTKSRVQKATNQREEN